MSTQTSPGQSFPTPCKRCGGALYPPDDTCPWCGASHAVAYGVRLKADAHALPPDSPTEHAPGAAHASAYLPPLTLPDTPVPPLSMPEPIWHRLGRWIFGKGLVLVFFLFALGYAGYTLFADHKTDSTTEEPAATGTTSTTTGTIQPYSPSPSPAITAPQGVASVSPSAPAPVVAPPVAPRVATRHRDVPESLQAARASLQANDLSDAQAALAEVLSAQPDNADARLMQQDMLQRELKRDAAVRAANVCVKDRLWSCVRHNATEALAIDATNANVRALLERSIREAGWNAPASPGARGGAQATAPANAPVNAPANTDRNARAMVSPRTTSPDTTAQARAPSPTPGALTPDANSADAREREIREHGWSRPAASSAAATAAH